MLRREFEEQGLLDGLLGAIAGLPDAHATIETREELAGSRSADALADVEIAGNGFRLVIEAKRHAFPRDVRETIYQLRNHIAHMPSSNREIVPFFIAQAISPGARDLLREQKIGFYDLGGSLFIPAKRAYIFIDRPPPRQEKKSVAAIFQGQKARVVHEVFARRTEWLSVKQVAEEAEVSPATASATLIEMERREWVDVEGAGPSKLRRLGRTRPVLDAWAAYLADQKPPRFARYYVSSADVADLARRLDEACTAVDAAYAVTSEVAAQAYAPHLSSISQLRCRVVPGSHQASALKELGARPVDEGWNLALLETRARGDVTVGERIGGIALAPPLQVYLDLLQGPGRSKDMAAHLRTETLDA